MLFPWPHALRAIKAEKKAMPKQRCSICVPAVRQVQLSPDKTRQIQRYRHIHIHIHSIHCANTNAHRHISRYRDFHISSPTHRHYSECDGRLLNPNFSTIHRPKFDGSFVHFCWEIYLLLSAYTCVALCVKVYLYDYVGTDCLDFFPALAPSPVA